MTGGLFDPDFGLPRQTRRRFADQLGSVSAYFGRSVGEMLEKHRRHHHNACKAEERQKAYLASKLLTPILVKFPGIEHVTNDKIVPLLLCVRHNQAGPFMLMFREFLL